MKIVLKSVILINIIILGIVITPATIPKMVKSENPGPFFSISLLCPNTNPARNQWADYLRDQLPKIGIDIDVFDLTGWTQISPRTWGYPGPYPIPTYAEGGYDIFCFSWPWGLETNFKGVFDIPSITPDGDNFYQYYNLEMDWAINNFSSSFVLQDKIDWALEIQDILYDDLPSIPIVYPKSVYCFDEGLQGWNGVLWHTTSQPMNNWSINDQTEFHYASPADFEDFHPFTYKSVFDAHWLHQIYNGLVERDPSLAYSYGPWLVESFSSADGQHYNVVIKDDACWANGMALTVDDVIYNYQLAVSPALGSTGYSANVLYWDNDSITKINDYEFVFDFLRPYVFQEGNLGLDLIPKHLWETIDPANHQAKAIEWAIDSPENLYGTGPYVLESYNPTNCIIHLSKNPHFADWYGSEPSFNDVYFEYYGSKEGALADLASGEIDMADAQFSPQIDELDIAGTDYLTVIDSIYQEVAVNMYNPWIGTGELCPIAGEESAKHIRKAISHLIDRSLIADGICNGLASPAITPYPPLAVGFNERLPPYEYNIEWSLWHMAQAGFDIDTTFIPPNTTLPPLTIPTTETTVEVNFTPFTTFIGLISFVGSIIITRKRKE